MGRVEARASKYYGDSWYSRVDRIVKADPRLLSPRRVNEKIMLLLSQIGSRIDKCIVLQAFTILRPMGEASVCIAVERKVDRCDRCDPGTVVVCQDEVDVQGCTYTIVNEKSTQPPCCTRQRTLEWKRYIEGTHPIRPVGCGTPGAVVRLIFVRRNGACSTAFAVPYVIRAVFWHRKGMAIAVSIIDGPVFDDRGHRASNKDTKNCSKAQVGV